MEILRDRREEFDRIGVKPLGVSRDSPWTHISWMQALDLNFGLLSDWNADAVRGIREIIVGTGGVNHLSFSSTIAANSEVRDATTFGVLQLTLHLGSYDWQFLPDGNIGSFTDSGTTNCH